MVAYLKASGWLASALAPSAPSSIAGGTPARPAHIPLPDSLERLIVARLDRLPPTAALVLKLCSALGPRFEWGLAAFALEGYAEGREVAAALQVLEGAGLLAAGERFEIRFLQSAVRDVLYSLLASEDRERVHRRAAEFLERAASHEAAEEGGEEALAVARARRWQLAARALFSLGRAWEAGEALERCLRLLGLPLAHESPKSKALAVVMQRRAAEREQRARPGPGGGASLAEQRRAVLAGALTTYSHHLIHTGDAFTAMYYAFLNCDVAAADPSSPLYVDACAHMFAVLSVARVPQKRSREWLRRAEELCQTKRCERSFGYLRSEQLALDDARESNNAMHMTWALLGWASNRLWAGVCDAPAAAAVEEACTIFPQEARPPLLLTDLI
eukprot:tig00020746_g13676.t1